MTMTQPLSVGGDGAVLAEVYGHTLLVTLNRPQARNAVNRALTMGVGEALDHAEENPDIWTVILTGAGDQAFCAGQDLKEAARGFDRAQADPRLERWGFAGYVRHHISKPTIAAVNGFALGGGTELVLASDLAVAAETATFGLPEVKRGLYAGAGGTFRLPRQIPRKIAMELILTGEPLTARRALELSLINQVVPAADVLTAAFALADRINVNAPMSVQVSKRIAEGIEDGWIEAEREDWRRSMEAAGPLMRSADSREGLRAFAEKRAPVWTGR
jgi:crotonobetainyl-CoA hydratase